MRVEIVTVGTEIIEGQVINSNAAFLSREIAQKGYEISRQTVLPDDPDLLFEGLKEALERSTLVVVTGGLGPTIDDMTKQVAARLFRTSLQTDSSLFDDLSERFGRESSAQEISKVPSGAIVISNRIGAVPGFLFLSTEGSLLLLPGAPREMEDMFQSKALPLLAEHFPVFSKMQTMRIFLCQQSESKIDPMLREIQSAHPDAAIGIYPMLGLIQIRLSVARDFHRLDEWAELIRKRFATYLFEGPMIQESVHRYLISHEKTLAIAESCTGGALSARLVAMPGASKYLLGSIVAYSNDWKESFLHVKPKTLEKEGAVSKEAVKEMVQSLLQNTKADFAIAVSGIAGPAGGSLQKPVGTIFIAAADRIGPIDAGMVLAPPHRASAIEFTIQYALSVLWRRMAYQATTFV